MGVHISQANVTTTLAGDDDDASIIVMMDAVQEGRLVTADQRDVQQSCRGSPRKEPTHVSNNSLDERTDGIIF